MVATRLQVRRGTAGQWVAANPVLAAGEPGLETDSLKTKYGNGVLDWNALPYSTSPETPYQKMVLGYNDATDTLTFYPDGAVPAGQQVSYRVTDDGRLQVFRGSTPISVLTMSDLNGYLASVIASATSALQTSGFQSFAEAKSQGQGGFGFIPAKMFDPGAGTPTYARIANRWWGYTLGDNTTDRVELQIERPPAGTVDIDLVWTNLGTGTGVVAWNAFIVTQSVNDGASGPLTTISALKGDSAGQQYGLNRTRIGSAVALDSGMMTMLLVERAGADPSDTLAGNNASVIGVFIRPTPTYDGVLVDDGGWCWFNEPRLLAHQPHSKVYAGFVTKRGDIGIASLHTGTKAVETSILHNLLEQDDHDTPGLIVLPSGKIVAFYSYHSVQDSPIFFRQSSAVGSVAAFDAEQTITLPAGAVPTYPKPVVIGTRLYVFFRNYLSQDYIWTDDLTGLTGWSTPAHLFNYSGPRGYVNFHVNGPGGRVDFMTTNGHPTNDPSVSLFHCYLQGGSFYKTDGTLIATLADAATAGGLTPAQLTRVYDAASGGGNSWGWDVQIDGDGHPVLAYATFPSNTDHRYNYARWTGTGWSSHQITPAGGTIVDRTGEVNYSGGLGILASDVSKVYLSRKVAGQFEVERWTTPDQGATWSLAESVTKRSGVDTKNIRPTTPDNHYVGAPEVFWLSGWFTSYVNYLTRLVYKAV